MPARARILVVEDEPRLGEILRLYLERDGHQVTVVTDGRAAIAAVDADPVDLVVLDLMLPGVNGEAVLGAIRDRGDTPVLIASAKRSDLERIAGLRMGADDYLAKPFNPHELTARVAAVLRRSRGSTGPSTAIALLEGDEAALSFDGGRLVVDVVSRRFTLAPPEGGDPIEGRLTPGELGLLASLARRPGAVLTRDQLLESVTRRPDEVYDRVIDVHVANLRRKLGDDAADPWLIETIPQTGYRLVAGRDARHERGRPRHPFRRRPVVGPSPGGSGSSWASRSSRSCCSSGSSSTGWSATATRSSSPTSSSSGSTTRR